MWFRLDGLADAVGAATTAQEAFVALALLEQACADRGTWAGDAMTLTDLRRALCEAASAIVHGGCTGATWTPVARQSALAFAAPRHGGAQQPARPTKQWPVIPECLSIHAVSLDEVVEMVRAQPIASDVSGNVGDVVVIGVRSAGSVLAPLVAATLPERCRPRLVTVRPSRRSDAAMIAAEVAHVVDRRSTVIVVDDPITSGETLRTVCGAVAALVTRSPIPITVGQRDAGLRQQAAALSVLVRSSGGERLPRRKLPSALARTAVRVGAEVVVPYGAAELARLELDCLRAVAPALQPDVRGALVSTRWCGSPPVDESWWDVPDRAAAVGHLLARWRHTFAVDGVPEDVWAAALTERCGERQDGWSGAWSDRLVRVSLGREWWHYRLVPHDGHDEAVTVPGWIGHWSEVVDVPTLLADAIAELALSAGATGAFLDAYQRAANEVVDSASLVQGLEVVAARDAGVKDDRSAWSRSRRATRRSALAAVARINSVRHDLEPPTRTST